MTTQPGWYDDGSGQQRYWDGTQWTEHVAGTTPVAPAPGMMPAGAGAPKKRRVGMWVGIGIGAFVLLCGGGIAAIIAFVVNATQAPRDTVHAVFEALEEGDCPALYSHFHDDWTGGATEEEFCGGAELEPVDISYSVTSTSITNGEATVRVKATIGEGLSGLTGEWNYILVEEDGQWLVTAIVPID